MNARPDHPTASQIYRLRNCPASHLLSCGCPRADTPESDRGTRIHAALAGGDRHQLTEEEREVAGDLALAEDMLFAAWTIPSEPVKFVIEKRLEIRRRSLVTSAQLDRLYIEAARALVIDFKTIKWGEHDPAIVNDQLWTQAVCVYANFPGIDEITLAMVQHGHTPKPVTITRKAADEYANNVLFPALLQCEDEDEQPVIGDWCRWCPAINICPAQRRNLAVVAVTDTAPDRWALATPEEKLAVYEMASAAERAAASVKARIKDDLRANPNAIPGLQLTEQNGARKIPDIKPVWAAAALAGVTQEAFIECCDVGIGDLEKAWWRARGGKGRGEGKGTITQAAAAKEMAEAIAPHVVQGKREIIERVKQIT